MKKFTLLFALVFITMAAFSQFFYEENFDDGNAGARWNVGQEGENTSDFAFDFQSPN